MANLSAADPWVVRDDGVGPVKIGMTLAQLSAVLHEKLSEQESDNDSCYYVTASKHDHIAFMIIDGRVERIDVDAPGIATSTGVQVGNSELSVRKIYGTGVKVTKHAYVDTGHYLTVRSADGRHGVRFEIDNGKVTMFYVGKFDAIQYIEGCE